MVPLMGAVILFKDNLTRVSALAFTPVSSNVAVTVSAILFAD